MHQTQSLIKADHVKNYTTPLHLQLLYTISKSIRSKASKTYQNKLFYKQPVLFIYLIYKCLQVTICLFSLHPLRSRFHKSLY